MKTQYNVVWYWKGGTESGEWRHAWPGADIRETVRNLERSGYVAVTGTTAGGPPDGPPAPERIRDVLRANVDHLYRALTA